MTARSHKPTVTVPLPSLATTAGAALRVSSGPAQRCIAIVVNACERRDAAFDVVERAWSE